MQNKDKETFSYTYSAKEQAEIQKIRDKYEKPTAEEDKMTQLRRLDASVHSKATAVALVLGIIGALIMGCGMSLVMTDVASLLGLGDMTVPGIAVGVVGMVLAIVNYPIYKGILNSRKKKYSEQVIALSNKILSEEEKA